MIYYFPFMLENFIPKEHYDKIPTDENYNPEDYPHYEVFIATNCGYNYDDYQFEQNAKTIFDIPDDKIKSVSINDLIALGCDFEQSSYLI